MELVLIIIGALLTLAILSMMIDWMRGRAVDEDPVSYDTFDTDPKE